jgi:4-oxalocrotonate tautomerase
MPLIEVKWFKGRDKKTKKEVIEALTEAMCNTVGCKPDDVTVIIYDVDKQNWGKSGIPYE